MHALSLGTWFIHIATVFEWTLSIIILGEIAKLKREQALFWLSLAMLPNLASAMTAITWHIFDNSESLIGLVVLLAGLTMVGNACLAIAAWNLFRRESQVL